MTHDKEHSESLSIERQHSSRYIADIAGKSDGKPTKAKKTVLGANLSALTLEVVNGRLTLVVRNKRKKSDAKRNRR